MEVAIAAPEDSPWSVREKGKDKQYDAYWRLDCPTSGTTVEAFWPDFRCWLKAKFVRVNADGSFCVQWKSDGTTSILKEDFVRRVGDVSKPEPAQQSKGLFDPEKTSPDLMRLLRLSRPKWSDRDVYAAAEKLRSIDILEVKELHAAIDAELAGNSEGVNQRLGRKGLRMFAEVSLRALRRGPRVEHVEPEAEENQPPTPQRAPTKPGKGAFSRRALQPQQVFSHEDVSDIKEETKDTETLGGLKTGFLLGESAEPLKAEPREVNSRSKFTWKRGGPSARQAEVEEKMEDDDFQKGDEIFVKHRQDFRMARVSNVGSGIFRSVEVPQSDRLGRKRSEGPLAEGVPPTQPPPFS
ncbi:unnamed protein product [Symbiodinium natans]|uniref:Uncharacterized protein n=1 Tax=Symbiodinium natans TaxID=878477 RepID=A0A812M2B6_9DINO|nr:unnamed protein product [Symbiodinium natans]